MKNKNLFKLLAVIVLIFITLSISAYGEKPNTNYHTWIEQGPDSAKRKYTFFKDGSGLLEEKYSGEWYVENFNWKSFENGTLQIITGESFRDFDRETYQYTLSKNGRQLTLEDSCGYTTILKRQ